MTRKIVIAGGLAAALAPSVVFAQQGLLEEVVVTAQRREQSLQDVPVSVTAFTGALLEKANIKTATEYLARTPNVSFTEDGQTGSRGLGISIRGVNNLVTGENAFINSVGVYLNEFSVASVPNQVINPQLPDMERIEVLRGPQGTYFGRNSVGGALNITTRKPTDQFEGEVSFGGEVYEDANEMWNVTGIVNLPVSDTLRTRAVVYYEDSGGLVDNICATGAGAGCPRFTEAVSGFTNVPSGRSDSGHDYIMGRFLANWTPTDDTSVDVTVIYTDEDQGHDENVPTGVLDLDTVDTFGITMAMDPLTGLPAAPPSTGFWPQNRNKLAHDLKEFNKNESLVAIFGVTHQLDQDVVLKLIGGVIDAENERFFDNDLIAAANLIERRNEYEGLSWSIEFRTEITRDKYDLVAGLLYAQDDQEQVNRITVQESADVVLPIPPNVLLPPPSVFPVGLCLQCNTKNFEVESAAAFADLTVHFTDRLDVIIGGRLTHDNVLNEFPSATALAPGGPGGAPPFVNPERPPVSNDVDFWDLSPRVSARYQATEDVGLYVTISKGYKAGGTSVGHFGLTPAAVEFKEETLWNYEMGFKSELFDRRLRLNGSVFKAEWNDLQVENFRFLIPGDLSSNFEETTNIDDAEAWGMELEFLAAPTERLTIAGGVGYLDAQITCDCTAKLTGGFVANLRGLDVPKSPKLTASLSGEYRWPFAAGEGWLRVEYLHRDGQFSDIEAVTWPQHHAGQPSPNAGLVAPIAPDGFPYRTPDYDVVNLRAGYEWNEKVSFNVFVANVFDEEYYTGTQENFGISGIRVRPHPRTFGGNVSYRF